MPPIIKKHKNKNRYLLTDQRLWVRDFTTPMTAIDINHLSNLKDASVFADNELAIRTMNIPEIGEEKLPIRKKWIIVSDGYNFNNYQSIFNDLPNDVFILAINRSLAKWQNKKRITFFVTNNPYETALAQINKEYYPTCILSVRTNKEFVKKYKGNKFYYVPASEENISTGKFKYYQIDDYRNPICASLILAYKFGAEKILMLCCDDSFDTERPSAEKLENGLYQYPQLRIAHALIDGNLYWMKQNEDREMQIYDCSAGATYQNASYIPITNVAKLFA